MIELPAANPKDIELFHGFRFNRQDPELILEPCKALSGVRRYFPNLGLKDLTANLIQRYSADKEDDSTFKHCSSLLDAAETMFLYCVYDSLTKDGKSWQQQMRRKEDEKDTVIKAIALTKLTSFFNEAFIFTHVYTYRDWQNNLRGGNFFSPIFLKFYLYHCIANLEQLLKAELTVYDTGAAYIHLFHERNGNDVDSTKDKLEPAVQATLSLWSDEQYKAVILRFYSDYAKEAGMTNIELLDRLHKTVLPSPNDTNLLVDCLCSIGFDKN